MKQEAPTKPRERKVTCQRTGWIIVLLLLCLLHGSSLTPPQSHFRWLQAGSLPFKMHLCNMTTSPCEWEENSFPASGALRGPRLVSGEAGGAVTIQCHYTPLSVNRHQRKYWCRLGPPLWTCRTIVSTNHYTHHDYHGRVALTDFPRSGLFMVRLWQLSLDDAGHYRCGIGNRNNALFFSMNLTMSAGSSNASYTAPSASGELTLPSFGTTSPAANKWSSGASQTLESQGSEWDSKTTPLAKGRQTPETASAAVPGTSSRVEGAIEATVPVAENSGSKLRNISTTTKGAWTQGTRGSVTSTASTSVHQGKETTTESERLGEETEARATLDAAWKATGTIRPSILISEHVACETLPERIAVSKPRALGSTEEPSSAPGMWTLSSIQREASVEGSSDGSLEDTAEESVPPVTTSQPPAVGSMTPSGKGLFRKSALLEEKSDSWTLTTVSTLAMLLLVALALVLLQRRLWSKRTSQETERAPRVTLIQMTPFLKPNLLPDPLPDVGMNLLQCDTCPTQASPTVLEKDPGP